MPRPSAVGLGIGIHGLASPGKEDPQNLGWWPEWHLPGLRSHRGCWGTREGLRKSRKSKGEKKVQNPSWQSPVANTNPPSQWKPWGLQTSRRALTCALRRVPAASARSPHQASATGPSAAGRHPAPTTCRCPSGAAQPQQVPAPGWAPVLCAPSPPLCPLQMKRHSPGGTSRWNSGEAILSPLRALRIPSGEIQILRAAKKRKHPCDWLLRGCLPLHTLGKWFNLSVPQLPLSWNRHDDNNWGIREVNECVCAKCLEWVLGHIKHSVNVSCYCKVLITSVSPWEGLLGCKKISLKFWKCECTS